MEAIRVASNVAASAASGAANAAAASTQNGKNTSTGSPLMNAMTYLMYIQGILILLLTIPVAIPYRAEFMKWLHDSPSLWRVRVVVFCINAFVGALLADTWLRLSHITAQIDAVQTAPNGVPAVPYGGMPGAAGAAGGPVDVTGTPNALHELFSASFRGQRDFYILSFTLFCSAVLFQLHLLFMNLEKRDKVQHVVVNKAEPATLADSVKQSAASVVAQMQTAAKSAKDSVIESASSPDASDTTSIRKSYKAQE